MMINIKDGKCFVLHKGIYNEILKYDFVLYPEDRLTLLQLSSGIRYVKTIVTENPWLISCYDEKDVFIFRDGKWETPPIQTYGCSVELIMDRILGISNSIPLRIFSIDEANELIEKIQKFYKKDLED